MRSSWPRDWTQVSDISGRFSTIWATKGITQPLGKLHTLITSVKIIKIRADVSRDYLREIILFFSPFKKFYCGSTAYIVYNVYVFNDIASFLCVVLLFRGHCLLQLRQKRWFIVHVLDLAMTENRTGPERHRSKAKNQMGPLFFPKSF